MRNEPTTRKIPMTKSRYPIKLEFPNESSGLRELVIDWSLALGHWSFPFTAVDRRLPPLTRKGRSRNEPNLAARRMISSIYKGCTPADRLPVPANRDVD